MMDNAIEVSGLTKSYGAFLAVDHISFDVCAGEIFGFLGPNGAGKSTTQRMLTTLLQPTAGTIRICGSELSRSPYPAKRQMGLVAEESNVYAKLTAWDNLMFTARLYRVPADERRQRVQTLLELFDLDDQRHVRAEHFSKGLRRRLSIAMALVQRPRVLFLDEPTSGLDVQSTRTIHHQIQALSAEGATVFLTTHQIEHANQLCDRVAIINHGRIAAIDTPERLKEAFRRVQSVEVALAPADPIHGTTLEALPGVSKAVKLGDKWRLYTDDPSAVLPRVIHVTADRGGRVVSLNTRGPSLEDVFLAITGGEVGTDRDDTQGDDRAGGEPRGGP